MKEERKYKTEDPGWIPVVAVSQPTREREMCDMREMLQTAPTRNAFDSDFHISQHEQI